jgi:hypothetical protein
MLRNSGPEPKHPNDHRGISLPLAHDTEQFCTNKRLYTAPRSNLRQHGGYSCFVISRALSPGIMLPADPKRPVYQRPATVKRLRAVAPLAQN